MTVVVMQCFPSDHNVELESHLRKKSDHVGGTSADKMLCLAVTHQCSCINCLVSHLWVSYAVIHCPKLA
jgi:hypothetical protein